MICCIFDLDDTLFPEHEFMQSGHKYVVEQIENIINKEIFLNSLNNDVKSHYYPERFERAHIKCNMIVTEHNIKNIIMLYQNHKPIIHLYPNVQIFLEKLQSNGFFIIIVTEGNKKTQSNKIEALGIHNYPIFITGNNSKKNDEKFINNILSMIPKKINQFFVFGDNPNSDGLLCQKLSGHYFRSRNIYQKCFNYPNKYPPLMEYDPKNAYNNELFFDYIISLNDNDD